jgi:glutathione peroxidase
VKWNFQKYLIDEEGKLVGMFPPKTKPLSEAILDWITEK